ncbi:MAG: hypothetical protein ABSC72_05065 [Methylovirgula sp.]|jgi:hypothetical protein
MSKIEIIPVKGLGSFLDFCKVPRIIYKGLKGFAPCLDAERWTLYAHMLNPHFKLVDSQAWIARRDGKLVGRNFAQVYKDGIKPLGASPAQFGCLDCIEDADVLKALLTTAEGWLRQHGATTIHGPFSPSVNAECGMLVEGFEATPMIFMPWNPPYLPALLEKAGYKKARDLISYRYDLTAEDRAEKAGVMARPEWRERLKIRNIDLKTMAEEAKILVDIFNDAWSQNWGFVPFTYEEFMSTADGMKLVMPPEGGFIIELDGEAQAFGVVLPNLHEITADLDGKLFPLGLPKVISRARHHIYHSGRLALFGIRRALHRKAVGGVVILALIEEMRRRSRNYDIQHVEFGWVLEDNEGMRRPIEMFGSKVDKVHRIYEKDLAA